MAGDGDISETARCGLSFFIEDERYSSPSLMFACLSAPEARSFALELLAESAHHRSVEAWRDERLVCRVERDSQNPNLA